MPPPPPRPRSPTLEKPAGRGKARRPWAAALLALGVAAVLWGSITPDPPAAGGGGVDKLQHFAAYTVLGALAFLALGRPAPAAAAALVAMGVAVEFAQAAMPYGREGSWLDAAANAAGVGLCWALAALHARTLRKPF